MWLKRNNSRFGQRRYPLSTHTYLVIGKVCDVIPSATGLCLSLQLLLDVFGG